MESILTVVPILMAEIAIVSVFLFAGGKKAGRGKFTEDPLSYENVVALICIFYIIMRLNDGMFVLARENSLSLLKYPRMLLNRWKRIWVHYEYSEMSVAALAAAGPFWFFTGYASYLRLTDTTGRLRMSAKKIRIAVAVVAVPLVYIIYSLYHLGDKPNIVKKVYKYSVYILEAALRARCLYMLPVLIFMFFFAWLFIKILKVELPGIVLIAVSVPFLFMADVSYLKVIGGANYIMFPLGLLAAKYGNVLFSYIKKRYKFMLILSGILLPVSFLPCFFSRQIMFALREPLKIRSGYYHIDTSCSPSGVYFPAFSVLFLITSLSLSMLILLALMKIRTGNRLQRIMSAALFEIIWISLTFPVDLIRTVNSEGEKVFGSKVLNSFVTVLFCVVIAVIVYFLITRRRTTAHR